MRKTELLVRSSLVVSSFSDSGSALDRRIVIRSSALPITFEKYLSERSRTALAVLVEGGADRTVRGIKCVCETPFQSTDGASYRNSPAARKLCIEETTDARTGSDRHDIVAVGNGTDRGTRG